MNTSNVNNALNHATAALPFGVSKCDVARATYAFVAALAGDAGFVRSVVLRWVLGWISKWRAEHGCTDPVA